MQTSQQKYEHDNESLIESQRFISDYINSTNDSYISKIESLTVKVTQLQNNEKKLNETIELQEYLYNKLQQDMRSKTMIPQIRQRVNRRYTSPSDPSINMQKSVQRLQQLLENKVLDTALAVKIGVELDEDDPSRFVEHIISLKEQRDIQYVEAQKLEDLILELKDALGEEDEYNLLKAVVQMKDHISKCKKKF